MYNPTSRCRIPYSPGLQRNRSRYVASKTRAVNSTQNRVHAYRSALAAVNSALQHPQRRSLDSTLLAVWIFNVYECTRLHSQIQALLQTNDRGYMLSNSPSILQDIDYLEDNAEPFTDPSIVGHGIPPPLASLKLDNMSLQSMEVCSYMSNFRMHISSAALRF